MTQIPLLSLLIWSPIVGAVFTLMAGDKRQSTWARRISLLTVLINMALCIPLYLNFDQSSASMQFTEYLRWLPAFGIDYELGVDGISVALILLTTFTTFVALIATWHSIKTKVAQYSAAFLIMQGLLVGVFTSLNAILFYIFWEATLVPMFLIIGIWGSDNRVYAAIKFFLYTFLGSVLMLIAFIYLGMKAGTFSLLSFYTLPIGMTAQILIFVAFLLSFAIKVPMWPVHTWLPDAHTEAPAGGSIVLAAVLLKLGAYGFLRFSLPIAPDASHYLAWFMIALSLIAVIYIGFVAIVQTDMKKLIAYSSISHMGFVTLGFFVIYLIVKSGHVEQVGLAFEGAIFVMISHGFISGALFAAVGYLYERLHTRQIKDFGGIVNTMPLMASFVMLFVMGNAGLPGTSGFVGEFMVILGSAQANFWVAFAAGTTLMLGAAYNLWMYKRVFFGDIVNAQVALVRDIKGFEVFAFGLLGLMVLFFGLYPAPILNLVHTSAQHILTLGTMTKL
ncbi:MAG: NADH-quinone oxidoreductase subunit M [Proteobacteria bacterium]|nr:NADH-quinone oxidoreductase subunit M [Pseudomonadota bacterium]